MMNRTDSLTHGDCGNQDMVTIAELCVAGALRTRHNPHPSAFTVRLSHGLGM